MTILASLLISDAFAITLDSFEPEKYITYSIDEISIIDNLSFGMDLSTVEQVLKRQGIKIQKNTSSNVECYLFESGNTLCHLTFQNNFQELVQIAFVVTDRSAFFSTEKDLENTYGLTEYSNFTGKSIGHITSSNLQHYPITVNDRSGYSERVISLPNSQYVVIHHYIDSSFAPYMYMDYLIFTNINAIDKVY